MANVTLDRGAEFRVGNVFSRAWDVFGPNILWFFCVTLVVALPNLLFLTQDPRNPGYALFLVIAIVLGLVVNTVGQAIILFAAFQQLRGQSVQMAESLRQGLARFLPIVGIAILYTLGLMVGMILLIFPAFMLMTRWAVAVPACVVEGLGPTASLKRVSLARDYPSTMGSGTDAGDRFPGHAGCDRGCGQCRAPCG